MLVWKPAARPRDKWRAEKKEEKKGKEHRRPQEHLDQLRDNHATRHGTAKHLVPRNGYGVDALLEADLVGPATCALIERQQHAGQCAVAMYVDLIRRILRLLQHSLHLKEGVNSTLDSRARINGDDGWLALVTFQLHFKVIIIHLAR